MMHPALRTLFRLGQSVVISMASGGGSPTRVAIALFLLCAGMGAAQDIRYAGELGRMPLGCRAVAMGGTGVALIETPLGILDNPALSAFLPGYHSGLEGARLYDGLSHTFAAAMSAEVNDRLVVAGLYDLFYSGAMIRTDSLPGTPLERLYNPSLRASGTDAGGCFVNTHQLVTGSVSRLIPVPVPRPSGFSIPVPVDLVLGLNVKYYWQTFNPKGKVRMGVNGNIDLGSAVRVGVDWDIVRNETSRELLFAAAVLNALPTRMVWLNTWQGYDEPMDRTVSFGVSYCDRTGLLGGGVWSASAAMKKTYEVSLHVGIEARYWNLVAFRAGLNDGVPSLGAGITYRNLSLDYCFTFDPLAFSPLRLAVGARF